MLKYIKHGLRPLSKRSNMEHSTEVVRKERTHDHGISVTIQCCGDSSTQSTVTIYGLDVRTPEEIMNDVATHHVKVASNHAKMIAAHSILDFIGDGAVIHMKEK